MKSKRIPAKILVLLLTMIMTVAAIPFQTSADGGQENPFTDVPAEKWYTKAVLYCKENGYMDGTSETTFAPTAKVTRAMAVTILWRMAGGSVEDGENSFADVPAGKWYKNAVLWAKRVGVASGTSDTAFSPNDNVTREQMAVMFMKYTETVLNKDVSDRAELGGFTDASQIHSWAKNAVSWAVASGLISGKGGGILDPRGTATRAEVAQIIYKYMTEGPGHQEEPTEKNYGTYVATDSDFYAYVYKRNGYTAENARQQFIDYIDDYAGHGITDLSINIFEQTSTTPSDVWTWIGSKYDWTTEGGYPVDYTDNLHIKASHDYYTNGGCDPVEVMIDELRNIGITPWLTFRMNDAHYHGETTAAVRGEEYYRFKSAGYMVYGTGNGYFDTCFNFEYAEVREHYLAYLREQINRYDVDGIDLDFLREIFCFEYWKNDTSYYCDIMTGFISEVKQIIEEKEEQVGHEIKLLVRVPRDIETSRIFGFDAREWVRRGIVDVLAPSPKGTNDNYMPIDEWVQMVKGSGVEIYAGMELNNSRMAYGVTNTAETAKGYAASAYAAGADKIYLSNYYTTDTIRFRDVWEAVSSPEKVYDGVRRHVFTLYVDTDYVPKNTEPGFFALPKTLSSGESIGIRTGDISADETVNVYCTVNLSSGASAPSLLLNGIEAEPSDDADVFYRENYGQTYAYALTGEEIAGGMQQVSLVTDNASNVYLRYLEIKIEPDPDKMINAGSFEGAEGSGYSFEDFEGTVGGEDFKGVKASSAEYQPAFRFSESAIAKIKEHAEKNGFDTLKIHSYAKLMNNGFTVNGTWTAPDEWNTTAVPVADLTSEFAFRSQSEGTTEVYLWFEFSTDQAAISAKSFTGGGFSFSDFSGTVGGVTFDGVMATSSAYQPSFYLTQSGINRIKAYAETNGFDTLRIYAYAELYNNLFVVEGAYFGAGWGCVDIPISDLTTSVRFWSQSEGLTTVYMRFEYRMTGAVISAKSFSGSNISVSDYSGTVGGVPFDGVRVTSSYYQPSFYLTKDAVDKIKTYAASNGFDMVRLHGYAILTNNLFLVYGAYFGAGWGSVDIPVAELSPSLRFWSQSEGTTEIYMWFEFN